MKSEEVHWTICPDCQGRGKKRKRLRKKVKLHFRRELDQFEKTNSEGTAPVRPKGYLDKCPNCKGSGVIKSFESQSIEIVRLLSLASAGKNVKKIELAVSQEVASFLLNEKRAAIAKLESDSDRTVTINPDPECTGESYSIVCYDERDNVCKSSCISNCKSSPGDSLMTTPILF